MKTVLITGGSRGIGRALVETFLNNSHFVISTSTRSSEETPERTNLVRVRLDLSEPASIEACVGKIASLGRKIDVLINNAGMWAGDEHQFSGKINVDWLRKTLEVNLVGTADFTERIIPLMNEGSHIVNVSSRSGSLSYSARASRPEYKISKAALNMLTKVLAIRLKGRITVSSVHPGSVQTDMGGPQADISPDEAAASIFNLANSRIESGQFWFNGKKFPW